MSEELGDSELGTLDYWESRYKADIKNYKSHGDVGDVWFGEDIMDRIIKWINKNSIVNKNDVILDVGCGNGMLLIELFNEGYRNLFGIDYSEHAVQLASEVAQNHKCNVEFLLSDILNIAVHENSFNVVLDKGTYDAISLTTNAKNNRNAYINNVYNILRSDGLLIITSCNWTKEELLQQFKDKFLVYNDIPTPQFKFGGVVGSVVTSIVLKKCDLNNIVNKNV